mmetsp:Transcript_15024/g.62550  ORF Transcript_15024/g.62550 Transcript_15024/m.62550 type:complete len:321 (-) Transcript_15024:3352-4314(-)
MVLSHRLLPSSELTGVRTPSECMTRSMFLSTCGTMSPWKSSPTCSLRVVKASIASMTSNHSFAKLSSPIVASGWTRARNTRLISVNDPLRVTSRSAYALTEARVAASSRSSDCNGSTRLSIHSTHRSPCMSLTTSESSSRCSSSIACWRGATASVSTTAASARSSSIHISAACAAAVAASAGVSPPPPPLAEPAAWRAAADALAAQRPTLVPIAPMRSNVATARSSPPARLLAKACAASRAGTKFTGVMSVPFSAMWRSAAKPAAEASGWPALSASKEHTAFQLAAERMYAALAVTRPWTSTVILPASVHAMSASSLMTY